MFVDLLSESWAGIAPFDRLAQAQADLSLRRTLSGDLTSQCGKGPKRVGKRRLTRGPGGDGYNPFTLMSANDAGSGLTAGAFASLLAHLGPDADRAGAAYEHLRRMLVSFFAWRGAATPEECADETLNRLASRLEEGVAVEDLPRFARGIARLVLLEHWRRPDARGVPLEDLGPNQPVTAEAPDDDALLECLNRCLGGLAPDGRDLILEYYLAEGRSRIDARKRMARALGVSESALRNRAQRLRDQLGRCIKHCLASPVPRPPLEGAGDTKS